MLNGVNVFRINFSHADHKEVTKIVNTIGGLCKELGFNVACLADLQGPKLRVGVMQENTILKEGDCFTFTTEEIEIGTAEKAFMTYQNFPKDVKIGEQILVDDGKLSFEVTHTDGEKNVVTKVIRGGKLSSKKGVNLPNTNISLPALTEKDIKDAKFAISLKVDWMALSFVRDVADIKKLRELIEQEEKDEVFKTNIIAKIEKPEAIKNMDEIIAETDGIMVARGDLGIEIPMHTVPLIQKKLVKKCKEAGIPVIIATQMMESMIDNGIPTRAEVNDVANSILDGADAVMLSGETAAGAYPIEVVKAMRNIIVEVEENESIEVTRNVPKDENIEQLIRNTICYQAVSAAENIDVKAIVMVTHTGNGDIPKYLMDGVADIAIIGENTLIEKEKWEALLRRPEKKTADLSKLVEEVFEEVAKNGDTALKNYTEQFDSIKLNSLVINTAEKINKSSEKIPHSLKKAIAVAKENIEKFHKMQMSEQKIVGTSEGIKCWQATKPIEKVGLYIPGGTAPLFSTVLMLGIPAKIAGCKEIVLCTPPDKNGQVADAIIYTAHLIGIEKIYTVGGIQAIAAMTMGTLTIPAVYKIFGPGNQYVTSAKMYGISKGVAIDMPAGPSEVMVLADDKADPDFVATDLLSQSEHGADSQVICIAFSKEHLEKIITATKKWLEKLPRKNIAEKALENSRFIVLEKQDEQIKFINAYAPEHLILNIENTDNYLEKITNAGSVFIGAYTPESAGDYASGTNHTLPTNGYAKMYSGVNMDAFTKKITYQKITQKGIKNIGETIEIMAENEGLEAHKLSVSVRLKKLQ
uniref:pyruvate kinase n=1 Tax=Stylophora pistillata TaxID=50429 RepID=A0A2B4RLF7_STYPI